MRTETSWKALSALRIAAATYAIVLLVANPSILMAAVPVIPGASGFGITTPAGRGGTVYRVTNLNASGSGSLAACMGASGPRVCIFEVSGVIRITDNLEIRNPNITIAGQTAPAPGIMIRGGGISIQASDVLIQHLRIRPGDDIIGPNPTIRAAIIVEPWQTRASNIVIDHCSLSWGIDQTATVYWDWDNITFLNNIFGEALHDSIHPTIEMDLSSPVEPHGYGPLLQLMPESHAANLAMVGNLFIHQVGRNPLSLVPRFAFVNNVVYNPVEHFLDLESAGPTTQNSVVGNTFLRGPNSGSAAKPVYLGAFQALVAGSRVFVSDNSAQEATSDPWSIVQLKGNSRADYEASSAPVWPSSLVARRTANDEALNFVLANVGARPVDRDIVDKRLIADVKNRTGQIVNCVAADGSTRCQKNGGGWPVLQQNSRALQLPTNPNELGGDGYTNLEKWLHGMAAAVEGKTAAPQPPKTLTVAQ